jgi:hypothetical protein
MGKSGDPTPKLGLREQRRADSVAPNIDSRPRKMDIGAKESIPPGLVTTY